MNYIITAIHWDQKGHESIYTCSQGNQSSSIHFIEQYLNSACLCFYSNIFFGDNVKHILFTDIKDFSIFRFDYPAFFEKHNINKIDLDFSYNSLSSINKNFNGCLYKLDVINYLAHNFNNNDLFLVLDSDCFFNKSSNAIFENQPCMAMICDYGPDYDANGICRKDYSALLKEIDNIRYQPDAIVPHFGGEFVYLNSENARIISKEFKKLMPVSLKMREEGKKAPINDEHFLNYSYIKHNLINKSANQYIKRIWTSPEYSNVVGDEEKYNIWHLPFEKERKIQSIFKNINNIKDKKVTELFKISRHCL